MATRSAGKRIPAVEDTQENGQMNGTAEMDEQSLMRSKVTAIGRLTRYREDWPDGSPRIEYQGGIADDGRFLLHGKEKWYYPDGSLNYEVEYDLGRKTGVETYRDRRGQESWERNHSGDTSTWRQWWPNGRLKSESRWISGICEGMAYTWDPGGKLIREAFFVNGKITGNPELAANSRFIVVSDVHTSNDRFKMEKMAWLVTEINEGEYADVDFLVITGDAVSSFLENRDRDHDDPANNRVMKLLNVLEPLEKPFYLAMGNHEYKIDRNKDSDAPFTQAEIDTIEAMWKRYAGIEPYYSFTEGGMKYLVLNSMRGRPANRRFDDKQVDWFTRELSTGEEAILFFHHPVKTDHFRIWARKEDLVTEKVEPRFMELCREHRENIRGIFVGHGHFWVKDRLYGEIPVYETSSFGDREKVIGYLVGVNTDKKIITETEKLTHKEILEAIH
jgi:hypothetical protein